jgi:hypothetical protein
MNTEDAAEDWEALLHVCGDLEARVCADEASYLQRWSQNVAQQQDLGLMAVQGGLLADRMAWVFVAGYQAALRSTFADQNFTAWGAFAVSEDRRGDPPLPGVDYQQVNGEFVISGHKTWVATVNSVQHLVVKAGHGERALYFNLPRHTQGLEFSSRSANFLAEMSQGSAHLDEVTVPVDAVLDASVVAQFAAREALYIYLAFLAYAGRAWSHNHSSDECFLLIQRLRQALAEPSLPIAEVKAIDLGVQRVLAAISPAAGADNARWEKDQRLISMYSPGIQQRKA